MDFPTIQKELLSCGMTRCELIDTKDIVFSEELRQMCEMNTCRAYGSNWMCPPGIGEVKELIEKVKSYQKGIVVQYVHQLEDTFDFEGMMEGSRIFEETFRTGLSFVKALPFQKLLPLKAGGCTICEKCTYPDAPCIHPDEALSSIEAHGVYVNKTLEVVNIPYNNGPNTVSYCGIYLVVE